MRALLLAENPLCIFCSGASPATTIEHCPPRALFQNKQWPEGFDFPACEECNHGTGEQDLIVSLLARMDPFQNKGDADGRAEGLMHAVNRQFPGMLHQMFPTAAEARKHNRELGLRPPPGKTQRESGIAKIPEEMSRAVEVFARKLSKGIYFRETQHIFPAHGCLLFNWFTNVELVRHKGRYPMFDLLEKIGGTVPPIERGRKFLNDQFEYKIAAAPDNSIFAIQARFYSSFGIVVFGTTRQGVFEEIVGRLRAEVKDEGPFKVLQSPTI